jgi:hypothetical protein
VHLFVALALWMALTASGCSSSNGVNPDASADVSTTDQTTGSCTGSEKSCSGTCVNEQSDPNNCGGCGVTCKNGLVCSSGACAVGCAMGQMLCGVGSCSNTQTDFDNCGSCGHQCSPGQVCSAGMCSMYCGSGTTACGGSCVNEQTDNNNCGGCNQPCGKGLVCSGGTCGVSCGLLSTCNTDAGAYCTNLQTDNANCGNCGTACPSGEACSGGNCQLTCQAGLVNCNGTCVDPLTDPNFCGASGACGAGDSGTSGSVCPAGQACGGGVCAISCPPGQVACNGACVDPKSNSTYCGASPGCGVSDAGTAGTTCGGGQICSAGTCQATCGTGLVLCNVAGTPTCVDPATNGNYCGATSGCNADAGTAGAVCAAGTICAGGQCSVSCLAGTIECPGVNGICVDPLSNPTFCGATGNCQGVNAGVTCPTGHVCSNGNCLVSCIPGQVDCQNQCIDPKSNGSFCGAIDNCTIYSTCLAGQICSDASCVLSCQAGLVNCNGVCINPLNNRTYCGADPTCTTYTTCPNGQVCTGGNDAGVASTCQTSCLANEAFCGGVCIDPLTDSLNCGATAGGTCSSDGGAGVDGGNYEGVNCQATIAGSSCSNGACVCPAGFVNCNNVCIDPNTNNSYCGATGTCSQSTSDTAANFSGVNCSSIQGSSCSAGLCTCPTGDVDCNGVCINPATANSNCGATVGGACNSADAGPNFAGQVCGTATLTQCTSGSGGTGCASTCTGGGIACFPGGQTPYCANPQTDNSNCGSCFTKCGPLQTCGTNVLFPNGTCISTCATNQSPCSVDAGVAGAYCAYTLTDNNNCGACGNQCPSPLLCSNGTCGSNCVAGETLCNAADAGLPDAGDAGDGGPTGPYCADTTQDPNNCGTCGNVCSGANPKCVDSVCCPSQSTHVCNGACDPVPTNIDPNNCGACNNVCTTNDAGVSTPYCWNNACTAGCVEGKFPPAACTTGTDPETHNPYVVCGTSTCTQLWLSSTLTTASCDGGLDAYHATQICKSFGYTTLAAYGGTNGDVCGTVAPDAGTPNTCSAPGALPSGGVMPPTNSDSNGPIIGCTVQWLCAP